MSPARRRRTGFTLIELLVVITIIGILVALLVPTIWGAVQRANEARVAGDINTLGAALNNFKTKYGDYPPSRIILVESGAYNIGTPPASPLAYYGIQGAGDSTGSMSYAQAYPNIGNGAFVAPDNDVTYTTLAQRSIQKLRQFFPKVSLTTGATNPGLANVPGGFYDFNGNSWNTAAPGPDAAPILLEGHECLAFFLGGIPNHDIAGGTATFNGLTGFNGDPRNPFRPPSSAVTAAETRVEPYYEFPVDRLIDDDYDGIPGFVDSLGTLTEARYFAYFSTNGGPGYDPNDVNFDGAAIGETGAAGREFAVSFPVYGSAGVARTSTSPLPNPYSSSVLVPGNGAATFQKPQSYQIISAGRDRHYGGGGQFTEGTNGTRLPEYPPDTRVPERDNITSFANGRLE